MQLTEHLPGDHHVIKRISTEAIEINQDRFERSLILGARLLESDWPVTSYDDLNSETIAPLLQHRPEVVLLGFGQRQSFPPIDLQREFLKLGIGLECMTLDAAARTFNVLMSENRRALAGFILPQP
ncbi:MAG: MTH938/NDUFAF3 family protein [Pseudomonadota bacterium]